MAKKACQGTVVEQSIATVYTPVAQITAIKLPGTGGKSISVKSLDSAMDSNNIPWEDKIWDGIAVADDASIDGYLDPALSGHISLLASQFAPTPFKVVFPNSGGASQLFNTSSTTMDIDIGVGEAIKFSMKFTITGPVTQF